MNSCGKFVQVHMCDLICPVCQDSSNLKCKSQIKISKTNLKCKSQMQVQNANLKCNDQIRRIPGNVGKQGQMIGSEDVQYTIRLGTCLTDYLILSVETSQIRNAGQNSRNIWKARTGSIVGMQQLCALSTFGLRARGNYQLCDNYLSFTERG